MTSSEPCTMLDLPDLLGAPSPSPGQEQEQCHGRSQQLGDARMMQEIICKTLSWRKLRVCVLLSSINCFSILFCCGALRGAGVRCRHQHQGPQFHPPLLMHLSSGGWGLH